MPAKYLYMLAINFSPFPELSTKRLLLRRITKYDAPGILKLRSDETVMRFIDRERAKTLADAESFVRRIDDSLQANEGITWGIAFKEEPDLLIGTIGYWRIMKEHCRAEIGYMLRPDLWGKGIMKEALLEVIDTGFNSLKLHSIEAHINPENTASGNILQATGFVKEAHFKEDFYYEGTFRDTIIYSRLQDAVTVSQ